MFARNSQLISRKPLGSPTSKEVLDIVKKYRPEKPVPSSSDAPTNKQLVTIKTLILQDNNSKVEQLRQLAAVKRRMTERVEEHVKFQKKIKDEERDQAKWLDEEYKRIKLENSCLNIEKHKLRIQIESLKKEITKIIEDDEERLQYMQTGIPIENMHQTNYSDAYTYGRQIAHTMKHEGLRPKTIVKTYKVSKMGDFISSPDTKVHDTYIPDHRRYEKIKDVNDAEKIAGQIPLSSNTTVAKLNTSGNGEDNSITKTNHNPGHILSGLHLKHQNSGQPKQSLKNLINGAHRAYPPRSPERKPGESSPSKSLLAANQSEKNIRDQELTPSRMSMERASFGPKNRLTSPNNRVASPSGSVRFVTGTPGSHQTYDERIRTKAEAMLERIDSMALERFGGGYIGTIGKMSELDGRIYQAQKQVRKKLKIERLAGLIALNIIQCFKKAFYVLQFYDNLNKLKSGHGCGKTEEISQIYKNLCDLTRDASDYVKSLMTPPQLPKLESAKTQPTLSRKGDKSVMSRKESQKEESGDEEDSLAWTPKAKGKDNFKTHVESVAENKENDTVKTEGGASIHSSPTPSHLVALDHNHKKRKVFDVSNWPNIS
jgi:hypothetical protein